MSSITLLMHYLSIELIENIVYTGGQSGKISIAVTGIPCAVVPNDMIYWSLWIQILQFKIVFTKIQS